uniref:Uncharacterized protein n=1 Tax=Anguilla anguilla TaxID=7936 RepID=A0A0E9V2U3_ANGAN
MTNRSESSRLNLLVYHMKIWLCSDRPYF